MSRPLSPFSIPALARSGGRFLLPLLILACLLLPLVAGCGSDDPGARENVAPTAELTSGPVEGEASLYRIRVYWTGADSDGYIVRYEYAVDPPAAFTEEEIADPTGSPGVQTRSIPGPDDNLDTLRVSKTDGDGVHTFDWVQTLAFNRAFVFSATRSDSVGVGEERIPTSRFTDMHAIYVRSVDDEGAVSPPDRVAFTAETVAPESEITRPIIPIDFLLLGGRVTVRWEGTDRDQAGGAGRPVGYLYRLLDLASLDPRPTLFSAQPSLLFEEAGSQSGWTYVSADTPSVTLFPNTPGSYIFGVRAVDEAGAAEPFLNLGRNAFKFQSLASLGFPYVRLIEPTLGEFEFRGDGGPFNVETLAGIRLRFQATCDAEEYGGVCEAMRWGLDIADLDRDDLWSDWGPIGPLPEIYITDPGIHVLYVQVKDDEDFTSMATIILDVINPSLDREALWVDDVRDQTFPRDAEHDAFWQSLFNDSGRFTEGAVDKYEVHGANDVYNRHPIPPTLADLARYRLVVWECYGAGYNGTSGLWRLTTRDRFLASYLSAGGQLWLGGTLTVAAMMPSPGAGAEFTYPKEITPGTFPWEFLKLASSRVHNAKGGNATGTSPNDNLIGVNPFPGRPEIYPAMEQDANKISPFVGSIRDGDAIFDPIFANDIRGFTGVLDSLYVYQSVLPNRTFNNKLNALRWHDPDPARTQGRTQWFGFPLYYMKKDQAQETFNRSIDWFREEARP